MPLRRPSATAPISHPSNANSSRAHRTNDSHANIASPLPQPHSLPSLNTSATPQQKVVQALVNRLKNKLPCNSGLSLDRLEADGPTQQAIEALVDLSSESLDTIAWALCELLDRLAKQTDTTGYLTIEVLQSQLFILKVLSVSMASRWSHGPRSNSRASHRPFADSPVPPNHSAGMPRRHPSSDYGAPAREPPPLDDSCARYILSVMVLFLRQTASPDNPLMLPSQSSDLSFRDFESLDSTSLNPPEIQAGEPPVIANGLNGKANVIRSQPSSSSVRSERLSIRSTIRVAASDSVYEKTHMSMVKSSWAVNSLIAKFAGRIIFHISASNWAVVFTRLRTKIHFLASSPEDNPDTVDLNIMVHSALNRYRLVQLLNELSSLLVNMGRETQLAIAIPLRSAVWHWINVFPSEFDDCIRNRGKTEGAPERVFDLLYSMNPNGNEKVFWPLLTVLNCTSSDRIASDFQGQFYPGALQKSSRKEFKFGQEVLKHANTHSKFSEVALVCALDMCRAATHVGPEGEIPLRLTAFDIAHEIKSTLSMSSTRKPFWESQDEIDIAMYAEALVSVYRFLPLEDSVPLFAICVEPERSEAVKTCAVRACLTLVQEAPRLSWQKPLVKLEEAIAPRFRNIFKTAGIRRTEVDQHGNLKRISPRPKAKRTPTQPLSDREVLLLGILSLWRAGPLFFLAGIQESDIESWTKTAVKLWEAPVDASVKVSTASTFRMTAELTYLISPTDPYFNLMIRFIKTTLPATLLSVVTNLIYARTDDEAQRLWIALAHQVVELFVRKDVPEHVKEIQFDVGRVPAFALTEIALLISLTSVDSQVSHLAAKGLRLISHAERQTGAPVNHMISDEDRSKRNPVYEQLGDPQILVVGRVGHQKRIRKLIRLITYSSTANVAVWQECYWRWRRLTETADFTSTEEPMDSRPNPQEQRFRWQNLTLFLAALSGTCGQEGQEYPSLTGVIPDQYLPDEMRVLPDCAILVENYITQLIDLLVSPVLQVRDVARDALGMELSPRLYTKLLKHMDEAMRTIEQRASTDLTEDFTLFLDQFIAVLKLLVENNHLPLEDVMSVDISSIMLTLASFIARFGGPTSTRIKLKFCVMCDSVCDRTDTLTLRKDTTARNNILDIVMDWIQPTAEREGELLRVQNELNLSCLRTSVKLLDRLQLGPIDNANAGDDGVHVVPRLFNKYSTALLQGLESCQLDIPSSDSASDIGSIHQKIRISQREAELRELVITGLSHLVSANTESGFKQCLPLAYDQDNRKRTIFAHVFARVIGQGTKFDPEDRSLTVARSTRLSELVRGSDLVLAMTICDICPASEIEIMISVLLNLFDTRTSLMSLLKLMIEREVANTDNEANIFRRNSICTSFLSAFARIHGYNYLRSLIQPLIKTMTSMPPGHGYEVDPNKAGDQDVVQNQKNVEFVASSFLEIISASIPALPPMFREICAHIAKVVAEVWPESKFAAMGAFMFLRFISPAVVAPEIVDIELPKGDNGVLRRGLMVIAKIIQNLANNIFFGKEAHMTVLNKFLESNITNVTRFLSELHKYSASNSEEDNDEWLGTTSDDTDMIVLHRFFHKHADKIGKELLSLSKPSAEGDTSAVSGKRAWDGLCALLVDLGAPLEVPRPSSATRADHREYLDLMTRYARRDTDLVREIFQETMMPLEHSAIFVLRLSKIDVEALDIELLMYHIYKILALPIYRDRMFEVIMDCTSFTSISEVPLQWLKYCAELMPADIRSRFMTTHILNPNALMQKYLRRLYNISAGTPFCGEVRAYGSVMELLEHVPESALHPLVYPVSLEQEHCELFKDLTMKVPHIRMPITLEVGTTHLRITSVKALPISPGLSCKSIEIIPLTDVSDVYNVSTGQEPYEFIIRRSRQGVTVYFSSQQREIIVKTIRSAKGRLKEVQTPLTERFSRFSNVPATLLHVGLLSVDLNDEELRGAAYDLLGAVCIYLNYDKSPIVACKAGFIPGDPNAFVIQLSEQIADFAPQLTLDFISEVSAAMNAMDKGALAQRINCLQYLSPWIKNLAHFSNSTSPLYERSGARLRDCIRVLSELSVAYPEIASTIQKYVWAEVGKLDTIIVDVVLDELVRAATDGGIGTRRCETIANIVASLSSINVRGRIYSKLRKALSKSSPKVPNSLPESPNWTEISTLIRLTLVAGSQSKHPSQNQLYVPEIIHLVTLVAGVGPSLVRKSVYGIIMNLLQSLYVSRTEDSPGPELLQLITECTLPRTLKLFGLFRQTPTSEYINIDPLNDRENLDTQEQLTELLVRIMEVTAGSKGLLNVWRARWMSLVTSMAFQLSPAIQTRSFIALATLAASEVDDDFLYQILVALRSALSKANETHTMSVVSMLRCIVKIVPALAEHSRYLIPLFWLAVALLQSSHLAFYIEATCLLRVTLESMERQGAFIQGSLPLVLLEGRASLEEITSQLDDILKLAFDSNFSFSLASIIFKGVRHSGLKSSAEDALRSLLCVTVRSWRQATEVPNGFKDTLCPDALGYFLALLPLSCDTPCYRRLLKDCDIDDAWLPDAGLPDIEDEDYGVPRISPAFLGVNDSTTALLVTTFVSTMLTTAQGDDTETEILYCMLSDIANLFPETVSMAYEGLQDRIKGTIANSCNAGIIRSVSNIFRVALQDNTRFGMLRGSASTLSTVDEGMHGPGRSHLNALDDLGMQGLASSFQFLPLNRGHATKMIQWIPGLVSLIIA